MKKYFALFLLSVFWFADIFYDTRQLDGAIRHSDIDEGKVKGEDIYDRVNTGIFHEKNYQLKHSFISEDEQKTTPNT